jgi:phosphoglycolate phosphatase
LDKERHRLQAVIFDIDGTLLDSKRDIAAAQLYVLRELGIDSYTEEDIYQTIGRPLKDIFLDLLPERLHDRIPEATAMYVDYYRPRALQTTRPFPGVEETLTAIAQTDVRMAVATTKSTETSERVLNHFGLTRFFVQVQGSPPGTPFKPDPHILNLIVNRQGWEPGRCLMVGDSQADIGAGKGAGMMTCGVTYGSSSRKLIEALKPDYIVDSFPEVLGCL